MEPELVIEGIKKLYPPDREKLPFVKLVKAVVTVYTQKNQGEPGIPNGLFKDHVWTFNRGLLSHGTLSRCLRHWEVKFFYNVKTGEGEFVLGETGDGNLNLAESGDVGTFPV